MLALSGAAPFATLQIGVIGIAAVLWLESHREERRRRPIRNLQSVLDDDDLRRSKREHWKRAA